VPCQTRSTWGRDKLCDTAVVTLRMLRMCSELRKLPTAFGAKVTPLRGQHWEYLIIVQLR
jgi:hypothetical protein